LHDRFHPLNRGFDEFFGFMGSMVHFFRSKHLYRGRENVREDDYLTDVIARETNRFIERQKDGPFFVYAAFNFIHSPLEARDEDLARFPDLTGKTRIKAAMTLAMDRAFGSILETLRKHGLEEKTLIFLTNDNGDYSGNGPFSGGKGSVREGGVRVPFFVQWKGTLPPGRKWDGLVSTMDILPTCVAAAGGRIDSAWKLDGVNLLPYLRGEATASPHDVLYWRMGDSRAVRRGPWKLTWEGASGYGQRPDPSSLRWRLYNLDEDIAEQKDVSEGRAETVAELKTLYEKWNAELIPPRWPFGGSGEMGQWDEVKADERKTP